MQIEALPGVDSTNYDGNIAEMLTKVRHVVIVVGGWVVGLLLIVSPVYYCQHHQADRVQPAAGDYIMKSVGGYQWIYPGAVCHRRDGAGAAFRCAIPWHHLLCLSKGDGNVPLQRHVWSGQLLQNLVDHADGIPGGGTLIGIFGSAISLSKYLKDEGGNHQ